MRCVRAPPCDAYERIDVYWICVLVLCTVQLYSRTAVVPMDPLRVPPQRTGDVLPLWVRLLYGAVKVPPQRTAYSRTAIGRRPACYRPPPAAAAAAMYAVMRLLTARPPPPVGLRVGTGRGAWYMRWWRTVG